MVTRSLLASTVLVVCGATVSGAQPPSTVPPVLDLTCHGYDEGDTRAYNCIPDEAQQIHMQTFVPEVGSLCNQGSVQEFPPGRIVFQIRCNDGISDVPPSGPTSPPAGPASYEIINIRRYVSAINRSDWLLFRWRALKRSDQFSVTVRFQQGPYSTSCQEWWFNPATGQTNDEVSIPAVCGVDEQWSAVTVSSADGKPCAGCGTFQRRDLPVGRLLSPSAADPLELDSFIQEITLRSQLGPFRDPE